MASSSSSKERNLEMELKITGNGLLNPPSSVDELLVLLNNAEDLLANIEQEPSDPFKDALVPVMKALIGDTLLRHSKEDVRIFVISCLSEILRIFAPEEPFNDDQMKEIFVGIVDAFSKLSQPSTICYEKALYILETIARVKGCLLMLDLGCEELVIQMFQYFWETAGLNPSSDILWAVEQIMIDVLAESEEISMELLKPIVASLLKDNENASPFCWKMGEKIVSSCATKLRPIVMRVVQHEGTTLDDYSPVVASICKVEYTTMENNHADSSPEQVEVDRLALCPEQVIPALESAPRLTKSDYNVFNTSRDDSASSSCKGVEDAVNSEGSSKLDSNMEAVSQKRERKPNSLMNPDEGYDLSWLYSERHSQTQPGTGKIHHNGIDHSESDIQTSPPEVLCTSLSHDLPLASLRKKGRLKKMDAELQNHRESGEFSSCKRVRGASNPKSKPKNSSRKRRAEQQPNVDEDAGPSTAVRDKEVPFPGDLAGKKMKNSFGRGRMRNCGKASSGDSRVLGEQVVGRRIKVWWPKDKTFYDGTVHSYDPIKKKHKVVYTDGDEEILNLAKQRWKFIEDNDLPDEVDLLKLRQEANQVSPAPSPTSLGRQTLNGSKSESVKKLQIIQSFDRAQPSAILPKVEPPSSARKPVAENESSSDDTFEQNVYEIRVRPKDVSVRKPSPSTSDDLTPDAGADSDDDERTESDTWGS